jgi:hypothetical protein
MSEFIEFQAVREQLLSGVTDVDQLILLNLNYRSLMTACSTDRYTNKICQDNLFWRRKVERDMGYEVMVNKLPEMGYREQYQTLVKKGIKLARAVEEGRLDYILYKNIKLDRKSCLQAASYGRINILEHITKTKGHIDYAAANFAARRGRIDVLEWLNERGVRPTNAVIESAPRNAVKWLIDHDIIPGKPGAFANKYASRRDVEMLNFLYNKGILPNCVAFYDAMRDNNEVVAIWLMNHNIAGTNTVESANAAIDYGNIIVLELLASRGIFPTEEGSTLWC